MAGQVAKRPRVSDVVGVADVVLDSGCPVNRLLRSQLNKPGSAGGVGEDRMRAALSQDLHALGQTWTPYGTLIENMDITHKGKTFEIEHINPHALLWYAANISKYFADFMCRYIPDAGGHIAIHADEVSPSDGLTFDQGREYNAMYWTFTEFPPWYLSREAGGFALAYIQSKLVNRLLGG